MKRQADEGRDFVAPLGEVASGWLVFTRGASLVSLDGVAGLADLCRAHFDGPVPLVDVREGKVSIHYGRLSLAEWARYALLWGRHAATITLNGDMPWRLGVRGGIAKLSADLRALRLAELAVSGGASEVDVQLAPPLGAVQLRISGGASNVALRYPPGVAVSLRVRGGASKVAFDAHYIGAVGGGLRLATPGYEKAADHYEIDLVGGANKVIVEPY